MREIFENYGGAIVCACLGVGIIDLLRRFLDMICGF